MQRRHLFAFFLALIGASIATPCFAHHVMDGTTPSNLFEGLLSGFAHPIIGIDHFAFLIAMGIAAAFTSQPRLAPLAFVSATVAGCLLLVNGIVIPGVEIAVACSVIVVGTLVLSGKELPAALWITLFSIAGIAHGSAYGGAILGAEMQPLVAYLAGFALIQFIVATAAGAFARYLADPSAAAQSLHPRLAGALAAGIGIAILVENLESALIS